MGKGDACEGRHKIGGSTFQGGIEDICSKGRFHVQGSIEDARQFFFNEKDQRMHQQIQSELRINLIRVFTNLPFMSVWKP